MPSSAKLTKVALTLLIAFAAIAIANRVSGVGAFLAGESAA